MLIAQLLHGVQICLVEGNKSLYDGLDLHGSNSDAALARLLDLPEVLVLWARGMTGGIAPLILGYPAFEHYTDVTVLGVIQEDPQRALYECHLGLISPATRVILTA